MKNTPIEDCLASARDRYIAARPKALASHQAACQHLPGGNTRTVLFHQPFPLRVERGEGAYLVDTDGHRYLDLLGEYSAGVFGHSHPQIRAALEEALATGLNLGAHNLAEIRLAELLTARFPAIQRVRFTNSGTEANLMAVSTARAFTGRNTVMVFNGSYHGGLLYFGGGGIPINAPFEYLLGDYNDPAGSLALIREHGESLACILVEPMLGSGGCIPADPAFLQTLREGASEVGALLIFDEVMTSRFGTAGAGVLYDITPDLMTLGKWVGGGMSFGAYGGRAEIMAMYDPSRADALPHAGTFNNNILSMKAGVAALGEVFTPAQALALHQRGEALRERLNRLFAHHRAALHASGCGSLMTLHGRRAPITRVEHLASSDDRLKELLFLALLERGYYLARRGFMALSMVITEAELAGFVAALEAILTEYEPVFRSK